MDRYIGLDVHAASCTAAVVDARGKKLGSCVLETNGQALVEFFKTRPGTLHVCLEEGTQAAWLVEILSPHVAEVVVAHVSESRGQKSDEHDAFALAERLRAGTIATSAYKQVGSFATLRQLVKTHRMIVKDTVRVQNRIKALFRARGVCVAGKRVSQNVVRCSGSRGTNARPRLSSPTRLASPTFSNPPCAVQSSALSSTQAPSPFAHELSGLAVPQACASGDLSPQEKAREFLVFNLSSCVTASGEAHAGAPCVPLTARCRRIGIDPGSRAPDPRYDTRRRGSP
jgi:transposase